MWWIIVVVVSDNEEEKSEMILISTVIMYMYNVSNVFISSVTIYVCGGGRSGAFCLTLIFPFQILLLRIFVQIHIHETQNFIVFLLKIDLKVMKQTVWVCQVFVQIK